MKSINGYVTFGGKCREAMTFYQRCFGGDLSLMTVGESPMADQWPKDAQNNILNARLVVPGGLTLGGSDGDRMATEAAEGMLPLPYVSLCIESDSKEEIERLFAALSEGGKVFCPLGEQFWGGLFGAVVDKFGVRWLLNCEKA